MLPRRLLALLLLVAFVAPAAALPLTEPQAIEKELMALRAQLQDAMKAKDAKRLRALFADGFTHIDAAGQIVDRQTHVTRLLIGEATIEDAGIADWRLHLPGGDTAIVTARSTLTGDGPAGAGAVRWMQVFVRERGAWRIAASQVTRMDTLSTTR